MSGELRGFTFGGYSLDHITPHSSKTKELNIKVGFEEALKLHLAGGECISKLNQYNRARTLGKRKALNLVVHLDSNQISVNEYPAARKATRENNNA